MESDKLLYNMALATMMKAAMELPDISPHQIPFPGAFADPFSSHRVDPISVQLPSHFGSLNVGHEGPGSLNIASHDPMSLNVTHATPQGLPTDTPPQSLPAAPVQSPPPQPIPAGIESLKQSPFSSPERIVHHGLAGAGLGGFAGMTAEKIQQARAQRLAEQEKNKE